MPCSKYKSKKQKALCFATAEWTASPIKEWTDWSKIKKENKLKIKVNKVKGG